jgi:hypothetical protein
MPILVVTVMAARSITTAVMVLNAKPMTRSPVWSAIGPRSLKSWTLVVIETALRSGRSGRG